MEGKLDILRMLLRGGLVLTTFIAIITADCDMKGLQDEWIPCSKKRICDNANYPQKMQSLTGVSLCPTGCRCYRMPKAPTRRDAEHQTSSPPPPGASVSLACNGGWILLDGMCYTLTSGAVAGYEFQEACSELGDATPVYGTSEKDGQAVVKVLKAMNRPFAWAILQTKNRPAAADWNQWFHCLAGDCKCTTVHASDGKWTSRSCSAKFPAACRREPRYMY